MNEDTRAALRQALAYAQRDLQFSDWRNLGRGVREMVQFVFAARSPGFESILDGVYPEWRDADGPMRNPAAWADMFKKYEETL